MKCSNTGWNIYYFYIICFFFLQAQSIALHKVSLSAFSVLSKALIIIKLTFGAIPFSLTFEPSIPATDVPWPKSSYGTSLKLTLTKSLNARILPLFISLWSEIPGKSRGIKIGSNEYATQKY